jgi:hypothetical protein
MVGRRNNWSKKLPSAATELDAPDFSRIWPISDVLIAAASASH